jgi:uncharacterized damage-inducible protein DinB
MHRRERQLTDLRYPVGSFKMEPQVTPHHRSEWIEAIEALPRQLRLALRGLSPEQLDTPYRPEGWTVRQLVHHLADSHMNSYVRLKLALTEAEPTIKPYDPKQWADLPEAKTAPIELSLALLDALHDRWVLVLRSMEPTEFARTLRHPESGTMSLDVLLALYAWHGRHHVAHITSLRDRLGW